MEHSNQQVVLIDDEQHSRFRRLYGRFRRSLIAVWCWLRSVDPPPQQHSQLMEKVAPAERTPLLQQNEAQSKPLSSPYPEIPDKLEKFDLLFVGLDSSGISTTAKKLFEFNQVETPRTRDELEITEINISTFKPFHLNIIDVPGFCKGRTVEEDAEMVLALTSYLKSSVPNKIPNGVFIVSRVDDNRFAGEGSDFSKMLIALSHCQSHWTDIGYSNVVLVLTHAAKCKDDTLERIKTFQDVFHRIFPKHGDNSMNCVIIENNIIEGDNRSFLDVLPSDNGPPIMRSSHSFKQYLQQLQSTKKFKSTADEPIVSIRRTPVSTLLPATRRDVNILLDTLLQQVPYTKSPYFNQSDDEKCVPKSFSYFASCDPCTKKKKCGLKHHVSKLLPDMRVLLADGVTEIPVSDIVVGNKLLNKDRDHVVVTRINKIESPGNNMCPHVGVHFYSISQYDDQTDGQTVFKYMGRSKLKHEKLDWDKFLEKRTKRYLIVYEVEVNFGSSIEDTFISDGYVIFAAIDA